MEVEIDRALSLLGDRAETVSAGYRRAPRAKRGPAPEAQLEPEPEPEPQPPGCSRKLRIEVLVVVGRPELERNLESESLEAESQKARRAVAGEG